MAKNRVILLIDDDLLVLQALRDQLAPMWDDIIFESCESGEEALEVIADLHAQGTEVVAVVSDHLMGDMTGAELLVTLQQVIPRARKIMLTGQADLNALSTAVNKGALYRYITKPWDATDLRITLIEALRAYDSDLSLERKNEELRQLNEKLEQQVIERTRELIDKNKELEEGITYASYVQQALFPDLQNIARNISVREIYMRPFNRVSGDFYWMSDTQDTGEVYLAVGDCTGHGIAGAFISVMHIAALNEAMYKCEDHSPAGILKYMKKRVSDLAQGSFRISNLHLQSETTLLCIDARSGVVDYASDTKGLIIRNNRSHTVCNPLRDGREGINQDGSRKIMEGQIDMDDQYSIYLYTDGITDQFGKNGKKLKYSGLSQWIVEADRGGSRFSDFFGVHCDTVEPADDATMVILDVTADDPSDHLA